MSQEFNTLELAGIYESQGYFQDALEMYQALAGEGGEKDGQGMDPEINAGLRRMESAMQDPVNPPEKEVELQAAPLPEKRIEHLLEQWLMHMVLEKRLKLIKQVKSR